MVGPKYLPRYLGTQQVHRYLGRYRKRSRDKKPGYRLSDQSITADITRFSSGETSTRNSLADLVLGPPIQRANAKAIRDWL